MPVAISQVILSYNASHKWINITMTSAGGVWSAVIPGMPYGIIVEYKMYIYDEAGQWLASGIFGYDVIDEVAPELGDPTWTPSAPAAGESVLVRISAYEPQNASGVDELWLRYYLGSDVTGLANAKSINMTRDNYDVWSAVIPGQADGATVSFFVVAYDDAGNTNQTVTSSYRVGFPISTLQIILLGVGVACGIVTVIYLIKLRKGKRQAPNQMKSLTNEKGKSSPP
jgi:uncharacterized membrane protein YciS (DUF1049 family)